MAADFRRHVLSQNHSPSFQNTPFLSVYHSLPKSPAQSSTNSSSAVKFVPGLFDIALANELR